MDADMRRDFTSLGIEHIGKPSGAERASRPLRKCTAARGAVDERGRARSGSGEPRDEVIRRIRLVLGDKRPLSALPHQRLVVGRKEEEWRVRALQV